MVGQLMFITQRYTPRSEPFMRVYWADFLEKGEIRVRDSCA